MNGACREGSRPSIISENRRERDESCYRRPVATSIKYQIEAIRSIGILRDAFCAADNEDAVDPYFDVRLEAVKNFENSGEKSVKRPRKAQDQNSNVRKEASRAFYALKARYVNQSDE